MNIADTTVEGNTTPLLALKEQNGQPFEQAGVSPVIAFHEEETRGTQLFSGIDQAMQKLQSDSHGADITEERRMLNELRNEMDKLNQETAALIQTSSEILPQAADEVVEQAESMGLVWKPLFAKIQAEVEAAKQVSHAMSLPEPDGQMETQIRNMRTATNIAFLEKERQEHPDRGLMETLYSDTQHPQEFVNLMVNGEGMYYDSQGRPINLEGYLLDYYQPLVAQGFGIRIESASAKDLSTRELDFVHRRERHSEAARTLEDLEQRNVQVPVLVMEHNGRSKRIPILFSDRYLQEAGAYAMYTYIDLGTETDNDVIYMNGVRPLRASGEDNRTIIEVGSTVAHEVDHAVFNFLHDSEYKQQQRELERIKQEEDVLSKQHPSTESELDELSKKRRDLLDRRSYLTNESFYLQFTNEVARSMVFEGLARRAQRAFMESQGKGLMNFSKGAQVSDAVSLLADNGRLEDQVYLGMALYGTGEVLTTMAAARSPMEQLYTTDVFDKAIVNHPTAIRALLRHFIANRNQTVQALNSIRETQYADMDKALMKLTLRGGLGKYNQPFILGREYFTMMQQIDLEVDGFSPEQVDIRLDELRKSKPALVDATLQSMGDKKTALIGLEFAAGKIRKRFDEEYNKLFE
jgi:hypothetical protein